jgi:hypothetical protein
MLNVYQVLLLMLLHSQHLQKYVMLVYYSTYNLQQYLHLIYKTLELTNV